MFSYAFEPNLLDLQLIDLAFAEDLGIPYQDVTTATLFPEKMGMASAHIISKNVEPIVICGLPLVALVLKKLDPLLHLQSDYDDGQHLMHGEKLLSISGPAQSLLMAERIILNFLQRLSAIATLTSQFVQVIQHTHTKILDTRKTLPGFRHLEKYAVQCGGGVNHRMGLYDALMIKDTHVDLSHGMEKALQQLPDDITQTFPVIVEVRTIAELSIVLSQAKHKVSRVLLDNMHTEMLCDCVKMCKGILPTEASGNINLDNLLEVAECGVDFISVGKITHSATMVDLSMKCAP